MTSRRGAIAILASGVILSACGSGGANTARATESPTQVAMSWFNAINTNDVLAAQKPFQSSRVGQIAWMKEPAADQSRFTDIHCHNTELTATTAEVLCTFSESASITEGNPDTFWSISFQRSSTNGWLIDNYGQG